MNGKNYVIVSKWGYPFGGGEEFLYQTMEYAYKLGMKSYWLSFYTSDNKCYDETEIITVKHGYFIRVSGGFDKVVLHNWLRLLKPDIVHHQGHMRRDFYDVCEKLRINFMSGFHFWSGGIILDGEKLNINIIKNKQYHKVDPELEYLHNREFCHLYTASKFVTECISEVTHINISDQIFASSSYNKNIVKNYNVLNAKYVTLINIHKLKGGLVLLNLLKSCPLVPFMCIKTENHSEELDDLIREEIDNHNVACVFVNRINNTRIMYQNTRILLAPSLADETFCRTVNEGMMNGIPIMSSGHGNMKYLLGTAGYILDPYDYDGWANKLNQLYFDNNELIKQSKLSLENYEHHSVKIAFNQFKKFTKKLLVNKNIMIFSPWCDQGLGIQSRNYRNILASYGYKVCIFALKPYNASSCVDLQKIPEEWVTDHIYYSVNNRENVKDDELINFVRMYNITSCLIPETCWKRVFEVAKLMDKLNVRCYAIPNIEIVRKDEIFKHRYFYKILCNNRLCLNIFNSYGITNTELIGYGIGNIQMKPKVYGDRVNFLFIGGMNAFSRKHILDICEAFYLASEVLDNIYLTCTVQMTNNLEHDDKLKLDKYRNHKNIRILDNHISYDEILDFYYKSDVSIQVSKHEGLGLGFYEAVATGTPVISLNTPPHNEIILDNINGWLIDCYYKKMTDNDAALFGSAYFDVNNLANKIINIVNNKNYKNIISSLINDYNNRLAVDIFHKQFTKIFQ